MSGRAVSWVPCVVVFCAGSLVQVQAQDQAPRLTISGTSTVRAWSCPAQGVLKVTPGKSSPPVPGFPNGVQSVTLIVPVKAIECEEEAMREHLRETLKERAFPDIAYQLLGYTLTGAGAAKATGKLTIAGVTKPLDLDLRLLPAGQGTRTAGETSIDMTQFNITPPTLWLGALKVGKIVRVKFDAVMQVAP